MNAIAQQPPAKFKKLPERLDWHHWLVIVGLFCLTLSAWYLTSQYAQKKREEIFIFQAKQIVQLVVERMEKYEKALWGGVAALHMMPTETDRNQWKIFADSLSIASLYPGIDGIGVIHYHTKESLPAYLAWQQETLPSYTVHPAHARNVFWPVTYIEPLNNNMMAVGLDLAFEESRYSTIIKARDTGLAQITSPIVLVTDKQKTPGFLLCVPWYASVNRPESETARKEDIKGAVFAPFIVKKLMDGTLENKNRLVNFSITDNNDLLYSEFSDTSVNYDPNPLFSTIMTIDIYGRSWQFDIRSSNIFRKQNTNRQPLIILIGGLVVDGMLLTLFLLVTSINKRVTRITKKNTVDLQASKDTLDNVYNRLSNAMDTMMDGLVVISKEGIIQDINDSITHMFGYEKSALLGKNVSCLMPEPYASAHDGYLENYHTHGETKNGVLNSERKLVAKRADGSTFPIRLTVSRGDNKFEPFFTGVIHDLSTLNASEMALLEKESILKAAMASSSTGLYITDALGHIVEANLSFANFLGYKVSELVGQHFMRFIVKAPHEDNFVIQRLLYQDGAESPCREQEYLHKDGRVIWGLLSVSGVKNNCGEIQFAVSQIADIHQQKMLSHELAEKNEILEEANRELNQFAYVASHDLKEPLRTLRTFTGYLLKDIENKKWDRVTQDANYLEEAAERMTHLVNDLLELTRITNVTCQMECVRSDDVLDLVQKNLKAQIDENDCLIEVLGSPLNLLGNKNQFCQLLQNLISNAIKYHQPNDRPMVKVVFEPSDDPHFGLIHVIDKGIGIADEHCNIIFLAFKKLHSANEYPGTGIGLAIVKKIVDMHNGTIKIQSILGQGSTFSLRLPLYVS